MTQRDELRIPMGENAETVVHISQQLDRLRHIAETSLTSREVRDRGYFLPSEEDSLLATWVSYHQCRNALHEIISTVNHSDSKSEQPCLADFIVGYSSALLLVEAARFLRDAFSKETVIRQKLNESNPGLQLEVDSFEKIQRSLTSPENAVKLKKTQEFFFEHLQEIADYSHQQPELKAVYELIVDRQAAIEVSTSRYIKSRLRDRGEQLSDAVVQKGLLAAVYAIQQWGAVAIGAMSVKPMHTPQLPKPIEEEFRQIIQAGDVLVTRKEGALTNYFLPGFWPHVSLAIGNQRVVESLKDGVKERDLQSPFSNDGMIVLRSHLSTEQISNITNRAKSHLGKPYDFDFDFTRSDRMVCTEVIYRSYSGIGQINFQLTLRAGRQTLSAEDLLQLALKNQHFQLVASYHPSQGEQMLSPERTRELVLASIGRKSVKTQMD
ncbi:YiiX/YebB-like N1pC/P60 family cysteine hydrolase [bacterium]|nr:YiiX/YebB-like N1pC/P60 family cysteine hydrolase [bacterium]